MRWLYSVQTFVLTACGGVMFYLIHFPLPWVLGPLFTFLFIKYVVKGKSLWYSGLRTPSMLIIGYMLGRKFTMNSVQGILAIWPSLVLALFITLILYAVSVYLTQALLKINKTSAYMGCLPAGLTQISVICEDVKGVDMTAVSLMQTIRVITFITVVPFIAIHGLAVTYDTELLQESYKYEYRDFFRWTVLFAIIYLAVRLGYKLRIKGNTTILPIIVTAILVVADVPAPPLPDFIQIAAQICMGVQIATTIQAERLGTFKKLSFFSLLLNLVLIAIFSWADIYITTLAQTDYLTAFLGTSLAGTSEMGIAALQVHADVAKVTIFQLSRTLFIYLIVLPIMIRKIDRRS
ncbi:MAG: AbrB family transcriptional regulator [Gracilibacteraceae bacterium]|jgi:membrane AbrB-like protein|nr:AbrB family transcriptional regulator [Gracilibacteraceae bacterium]